jgi:putative hemin transport protein
MSEPRPEALREAYVRARDAGATRHRDIAATLGVSEGELIAAHLEGAAALRATRLRNTWPDIVAALESAGETMALTRNASCVHEKTGVYRKARVDGALGLVLGDEIDLRIFYRRWAHGFAVEESTTRGTQRSLQFFDASGTAIHKVFSRAATDLAAWHTLVERFAAPAEALRPEPPAAREPERPDAEVDLAGFRGEWSALRDTHEFFGLLKRHRLGRTQALRLAGQRFAQPVDNGSAQRLLAAASAGGTAIMVFVGNPGMIQIHTGPVSKVAVMGPWLNVLDPGFNLHLREDHIASSWVVRKPTVEGLVHSLELFDAQGDTIAMFFGARKPGKPELCAWRELIEQIAGDAAVTA